jgi:hypothetical protein
VRPELLGTRGGLGRWIQNLTFIGYPRFVHRLTDEYTATYIYWLTDKYTGLHSSVLGIFLSFGNEEYSSVIFLGTEEYKKNKKIPYFPVVIA